MITFHGGIISSVKLPHPGLMSVCFICFLRLGVSISLLVALNALVPGVKLAPFA
jgi:hypothetical protein